MVRPKKFLGQHFLHDENIAQKIVGYLNPSYPVVLEIGPGMGALSKYLLEKPGFQTWFMEIDRESIAYLVRTYPEISKRLIEADFLKYDLSDFPPDHGKAPFGNSSLNKAVPDLNPFTNSGTPSGNPLSDSIEPVTFTIIGNFPYNISSQILFRALENRNRVGEIIGMFQKEVAQRLAAPPGNKTYGILSVLLQAYYEIDYLFTVNETVFYPPPKVKSAVIRLRRNTVDSLHCDETLFTRVVKTAFNQRRKTLRNALRPLTGNQPVPDSKTTGKYMDLRAERLSVNDFINLTRAISDMGR